MRTTSEKLTNPQPIFSAQTLVISGITWAVLALLYFLLFSLQPQPWYSIGTYIFEWTAFLSAAILCLRNWRSPQIVSGRSVWLAVGLGMLSYVIGIMLFGCWELIWHLEPDVTLGDLFYLICYVCLAWGMILAVISKRLNLEMWQWGVLLAIAAAGIAFAVWISAPSSPQGKVDNQPASIEQVAPKPSPAANASAKKAPAVKASAAPAANAEPAASEIAPPSWVVSLDDQLKKVGDFVGLFYVVSDVFLLIVASALLLAFWGGRFSQSWRMIAAATFSLYIADMWFQYAEKNIENYQSGSLLEVFWIFSGVLFGIGAVLEYDISTRSRRSGRRRGGGAD